MILLLFVIALCVFFGVAAFVADMLERKNDEG
jgi:hypothetical protein